MVAETRLELWVNNSTRSTRHHARRADGMAEGQYQFCSLW
jgi:hypothetical protein